MKTKNNIFTNLKTKVKQTNYNFSKNLYFQLMLPLFIIILGLILVLCCNFNLGYDFKGGSVATVVVENDLSQGNNYKEAKDRLDKVLKENNINGDIYQKVSTSYYGDAITVKFSKLSDDLKVQLRQDLINEFYPTLEDADDLEIFVKVENFGANVSLDTILSTALAIIVMIVAVFVYISARYGLSAGFVSMLVSILDAVVLLALLGITRVSIEVGALTSFAFVSLYSLISSLTFISCAQSNISKEKFQKESKYIIANVSVKEVLVKYILFAIILLVISLLMGVVPTHMVRSSSLPIMMGVLVVLYSSIYVVPGLWSLTYIRKKNTKTKQDQTVVVEEKLSEEDITKAPEVIVETEAKEK